MVHGVSFRWQTECSFGHDGIIHTAPQMVLSGPLLAAASVADYKRFHCVRGVIRCRLAQPESSDGVFRCLFDLKKRFAAVP